MFRKKPEYHLQGLVGVFNGLTNFYHKFKFHGGKETLFVIIFAMFFIFRLLIGFEYQRFGTNWNIFRCFSSSKGNKHFFCCCRLFVWPIFWTNNLDIPTLHDQYVARIWEKLQKWEQKVLFFHYRIWIWN